MTTARVSALLDAPLISLSANELAEVAAECPDEWRYLMAHLNSLSGEPLHVEHTEFYRAQALAALRRRLLVERLAASGPFRPGAW